ncbi:MAG TPA: hypothetical protein DC054_23360 [Blastocatellia bacterium]|nr:hypothetical protein [Blastocatellia bacterium]
MRVTSRRTRNLIVVFPLSILLVWLVLPHSIRHAIHPTAFAATKTFTVNVTGDAPDANIGDGICQTSVAGNCSLRAAIQESNAASSFDLILFNIPGSGVHTISPASPLPAFTDGVLIDGSSQPGASLNTLANSDNSVLLIEIDGTNAPGVGFDIQGGEGRLGSSTLWVGLPRRRSTNPHKTSFRVISWIVLAEGNNNTKPGELCKRLR